MKAALRGYPATIGVLLILLGIAGFVPALLTPGPEVHPLSIDTPHNQLFGLFPVSAMDNIFHMLLGGWGLYAARRRTSSVSYARVTTGVFATLTLLGFVPFSDLFPLYGNDIWLHAVMTLIAAYFGWVHRTPPA
ncbi:MAG: DUF4383 domain-containing protein [Sphingomonas sp.]